MNIKKSTILKFISGLLAIVVSAGSILGLVGITLISVGRDYFTSSEFNDQIDNMDLASLTFIRNGEKITLEQYVKDYVTDKVEQYVKENPYADLTNLLLPFADSVTDFAVDKVLSSNFINTAVKSQVHWLIDYFLFSDADEAIKRIKEGITLEDNVALNPDNAPTFEERVVAEVRMAVFKYIEKESGLTCDQIIVMISPKTVTALKIITTVFTVVAVALFIYANPFCFLLLLYWIYEGYVGQMYSVQANFRKHYNGLHDLASYEFLKPLMDVYFEYANKLSGYDIILMLATAVLSLTIYIIYRKLKKKEKET